SSDVAAEKQILDIMQVEGVHPPAGVLDNPLLGSAQDGLRVHAVGIKRQTVDRPVAGGLAEHPIAGDRRLPDVGKGSQRGGDAAGVGEVLGDAELKEVDWVLGVFDVPQVERLAEMTGEVD